MESRLYLFLSLFVLFNRAGSIEPKWLAVASHYASGRRGQMKSKNFLVTTPGTPSTLLLFLGIG